jgi:hypothetical protein
MDSKPLDSESTKRPYVKPEFTQVALRPEEAVLGGCKSTTSSGPAGPTCKATSCSTTSVS